MYSKLMVTAVFVLCPFSTTAAFGKDDEADRFANRVAAIRDAVEDLTATFGDRYPDGQEFLARLRGVAEKDVEKLQREALLANPLLADQPILFVVRHRDGYGTHEYMGAHTFKGKGSALKLLDVKTGKTSTLVDCPDGSIRRPCVHFDGRRVVFSMNKGGGSFHIYEVDLDADVSESGNYPVRQLTSATDVSDVDPIYLPGGSIVFASSRDRKIVPCDTQIVPQLFCMTGSGANIHQITRSTVHENQVSLMPDGRLLYSRWDYVDRNFGDGHGFWVANPDGTNQALIWGNNTAHPSAGWNARVIPGTGQLLCVLGTHHGNLGGALAILDPRNAMDGYTSVVRTWPAHVKERFDNLEMLDMAKEKRRNVSVWKAVETWPERAAQLVSEDPNLRIHRWVDAQDNVKPWYDTPWPLTDSATASQQSPLGAGKYFLCARATHRQGKSEIWLVDIFGNELLIHNEDPGCYSPMQLATSHKPIAMTPRRDYGNGDGYFFVQDVYQGTHMKGVERGSVKQLRVVEVLDKDGLSGGRWNCLGSQSPAVNWSEFNTKQVLGTAAVSPEGNAYFAVPSDRFVYFQLLDENGMMIQTMRSGTSVHSGETVGCVGCHESRLTANPSHNLSAQPKGKPSKLKPWYGPTRRFSYVKEIQPVLDRHCVECHDFGTEGGEKVILSGDRTLSFNFSYVELWRKGFVGAIGAGPAGHLPAYTWGSHGSKLIRLLLDGHEGVELSHEDLDRLITWVDLNGPYYPTSCSTDGGGGRSKLDVKRILTLANLREENVFRNESFNGPMVNIDRPQLSPCLSRVEKGSARYDELLAAIHDGRKRLQANPRGDVMEGFVPHDRDRRRLAHRKKYHEYELQVREAIREGRELHDTDLVQ